MVTVTMGYDALFQNWLYWFHKLSLGMKLIVVAEDKAIQQKYENTSAFSLVSFGFPQVQNSEAESGLNYDTPEFNLLTSRRPFYMLGMG